MTPIEAARLMAAHAKRHHAGAFGAPLASDLAKPGSGLWAENGVAAVIRKQTRDTWRTDWTGTRRLIPEGALVASSISHEPGILLIDPSPWDRCDYLIGYAEDTALAGACQAWRRPVAFTRISASSEIITCWGPRGSAPARELPADQATAVKLDLTPPGLDAMVAELGQLTTWHDDYPFYSDGTWGAINLRGFDPTDPLWGVKPSEMPKKWQAQHPEAMSLTCGWTTIADHLPAMVAAVEAVPWWTRLERVRLMRMAAKPGGGKLARHSDVTDRAAGTRDGQVARFHIPLVSHPSILMAVWELNGLRRDLHLAPGTVWYLDQRKPHAVANPSEIDRVHLVVDVLCDATVREHLALAG